MNLLEIILLIALAVVVLRVIVRRSDNIEYNNLETGKIAKHQKAILWLFVVNLSTVFVTPFSVIIVGIYSIVAGLVGVMFVYRLAKALKSSPAWVYAILFFFPFVGLVALLVLNGRATRALRAHGVRVGVMGANKDDLNKLLDSK